jgi:copper homeostasis protein
MLVEAAVETIDAARRAVAEGAGRLELCADLPRDGVTPSAGFIRTARAMLEVPLHVLVRPRPGDFVYGPDELGVMLADIAECRRAGVDGVVIGAMTSAQTIDREQTARLLAAARPLAVTFHRAIDLAQDPAAALTTLVELGVERVLTSGGGRTAADGSRSLARLQQVFGGVITLMAGGGVRSTNAQFIVSTTGVRELHVGVPADAEAGRVRAVVAALFGMPSAASRRAETP